jgi:hypothetical protein
MENKSLRFCFLQQEKKGKKYYERVTKGQPLLSLQFYRQTQQTELLLQYTGTNRFQLPNHLLDIKTVKNHISNTCENGYHCVTHGRSTVQYCVSYSNEITLTYIVTKYFKLWKAILTLHIFIIQYKKIS